MKIAIVGGGPAGLYLSILLKQADRRHEIVVLERNPPDATFGFGVVFSDETLGKLRDADYESWLAITDSFARWNAIDIKFGESAFRSRGHAFAAISRQTLLTILQRRAAELSVDLSFEHEAADVDSLADADLVVGADGVNSTVRRLRERDFAPTVAPYPSKFVWFGTDLVFDAFTFVFRETEHGVFQMHGYPFDAGTSTFIVECNQATWEHAGLEGASEEDTLAFCADLFAEELGDHRLLSNRSVWLTFNEVRTRNWSSGNLVLVGDAAHTAHFTIGSGTKLALEDSIGLAEALVRRDDLTRALAEYELERKPLVERFQEAARESATYFENVVRYRELPPIQFAFNLLTRSGRIGYTNLTLRDPALVQQVDAHFGGRRLAPPPMFAPLQLGQMTLPNRVAAAPAVEDAAGDGSPGAGVGAALEEAAAAGTALVLTPFVAVASDARISRGTPGLYDDRQLEEWRRIVAAVQGVADARIALRLGHAGRRAATLPRSEGSDIPLPEGWPLLSASALPYTTRSVVPKAMDRRDMDVVRDRFAQAARRAVAAGFDALELDCAHGYLLASFLSPLTNTREDEYGGSLERRLRFPLEVLDAVREVWPAERVLSVRLTVADWAPRGLTQLDAIESARAFAARGVDLLVPVAGQTVAGGAPRYRRGYLVPFSDAIRSAVGVPTLTGGYVTTNDEVNTIIAAGRGDLCVLDPSPAAAG